MLKFELTTVSRWVMHTVGCISGANHACCSDWHASVSIYGHVTCFCVCYSLIYLLMCVRVCMCVQHCCKSSTLCLLSLFLLTPTQHVRGWGFSVQPKIDSASSFADLVLCKLFFHQLVMRHSYLKGMCPTFLVWSLGLFCLFFEVLNKLLQLGCGWSFCLVFIEYLLPGCTVSWTSWSVEEPCCE